MSRVDSGKIRKHAADGTLVEAGFAWLERRPLLHEFMGWACAILSIIALLALIAFFATGQKLIAGTILLTCVFGIWWINRLSVRCCVRKRQLVFRRDGSAEYTYGFPLFGHPRPSEMRISHFEIKSIEVDCSPYTGNVVVIYYRSGESHAVTIYQLSSSDTRIIAVQLQLALEEIQASGKLAPARKRSEGRGVEQALID